MLLSNDVTRPVFWEVVAICNVSVWCGMMEIGIAANIYGRGTSV